MKYFMLPRTIFFTLFFTSFLLADPPVDWDSNGDGLFDDINIYQNSGSITSRAYLDGIEIGSDGDALAAFVDGEQR